MDWTNLAILSAGIGIGAAGTWLATRFEQNTSSVTNVAVGSSSSPDSDIKDLGTKDLDAQHLDGQDLDTQRLNEHLSQQLQQTRLAYQMAREMAEFKAGFLARTSHELRSPINSVISLHQLILADLCEDVAEERSFVAQANDSAQKMLALLDQLIKVSKATHGTDQLQIQPLQLQDVLMEVQQFTHLQARNRNLRLEVELPDLDVYVLADPNWLRQVLLNLVDTPIALMQEGSIRLFVHPTLDTEYVHIWIEDERPAEFWRDSLDLVQENKPESDITLLSKDKLQDIANLQTLPSPGLTLLINQTLLESMNGRLEVLAIPSLEADALESNAQAGKSSASHLTRIQCSIPRVSEDDR